MSRIPKDHLEYLSIEFEPEIELDYYSQDERDLLLKYGTWLRALMIGEIEPVSDEQKSFLHMCNGKRRPESELEHLWKKHQLDLMYKIAVRQEYHVGSRWSSGEIHRMFTRLAEQGHRAAMEKCGMDSTPDPSKIPLINICRIYPKAMDLYKTSSRLPGSFGSRQ